MGDGRHAFTYTFESYVRNGRSHTIEARLYGPNRYLHGSPAMITCALEEVAAPPATPVP